MNRSLFNQNFMMLAKTSMHSCGIKISNIYNTINTICTGVHERRATFYYFHATFSMILPISRFTDVDPLQGISKVRAIFLQDCIPLICAFWKPYF